MVRQKIDTNLRKRRATPGSRHISVATLLAASLLLNACAGYAPNNRILGNHRDQVIQIMGQPSTELTTAEGKVMMYPRGPFGKHTYFVYLTPDDKVERWMQVLDEKNFERIKPGMRRDEVVAIIGESKIRDGIAFGRGYVWSWRYVNPHCFWFRAEFTPEDIVRSTMYQKSPECRLRR